MTHEYIIKNIHKFFKDDFNLCNVSFDSNDNYISKDPYVSLKYTPSKSDFKALGISENYFLKNGNLRIFIYNINPTQNMIILDSILTLLKNNKYYNLKYTELDSLSSAIRVNDGDLFVNYIDFNVEYCY